MTRPNSVWKDFAINTVGTVTYAAAQWSVLVILARLGTPQLVGQYALALAVAAPVIMFANMRLNVLLASDAARGHSVSAYLTARVVTSAAAVAGTLLLGAVSGSRGAPLLVLGLVAVAKAVESISDLAQGYFWLHRRFAAASMSLAVRGLLTIAFVATAVVARPSAASAAAGVALAMLVGVAVVDLPTVVRLARGESPALLGAPAVRRPADLARLVRWQPDAVAIIRGALPLGFVALALSLNATVPRVFIERQLGLAAVGYFAALAYIVVGARLVMSSLAAAAVPRLGETLANFDRAGFDQVLLRLVAFGAGAGALGLLGATLLGRRFLALLYGPSYAVHAPLLVLLVAAGGLGFMSTYLQDSLTTMRILLPKAVLLVIVTAVLALACALLLPTRGLLGAGWAVLLASAVEVAGSIALVRYALRRRWSGGALAAST